ncbi:MAG TPA: CPBP family intramembrane glutamic endopeptidase [Candidatus Acidoferrales bacterium]|nr:CPBP family intramembrane glutamic endopeptidase [Candidatus Acidoferrales bacterium]
MVGLAYLVSAILIAIFGFGAREQGMPTYWDGPRVPPYLASLLTVAVFVPIVEESTCRGLGFYLLQRWGDRVALGGSALAFALMHGAIVDFPWVLTLGLGLGYVRARSASLYPSMLTHGFINGVALVAAAAAGGSPT